MLHKNCKQVAVYDDGVMIFTGVCDVEETDDGQIKTITYVDDGFTTVYTKTVGDGAFMKMKMYSNVRQRIKLTGRRNAVRTDTADMVRDKNILHGYFDEGRHGKGAWVVILPTKESKQ